MSDHITVVGTIANTPERRRTGAGLPIVNFRLATNVRRRDEASGTWVDGHTNWYSVSAYRGLAEHALASFQRGQRVIVTGGFKLREWEANGRQGVSAEIDAVSMGHDLLWGTSQFRRDDRTARETEVPPSPMGETTTTARREDGADVAAARDHSGSWAPPALVEEVTPF
jgi:single-strand DNA-binding protein